MAATNPITGDKIQTKTISQQYRDAYDAIFRNVKEDKDEADVSGTELCNDRRNEDSGKAGE